MAKTYDQIFLMACIDINGTQSSSHAVQKAIRVTAYYWACVLFCRRWFIRSHAPGKIHLNATALIIRSARSQYIEEKRRLVRYVWPIFMAAIETNAPVDRGWLLERLYDLRTVSAESAWAWNVANHVMRLRSVPGTPYVDLWQFVGVSVPHYNLSSSLSA